MPIALWHKLTISSMDIVDDSNAFTFLIQIFTQPNCKAFRLATVIILFDA